MPTLRLTQITLRENYFRVEIRFEDEAPIPVEFSFEMTNQDYAYIRWYLESFLQYPMNPAPEIAGRVEGRMREIGVELYEKIFSGRDALKLWGRLQTAGLGSARVEIVSGVHDAVAIPWELLRDPDTDTPLALEALAFVRSPVNPSRLPKVLSDTPGKVRILLVICRPGGGDDVPFRSVAGKLFKGFDEKARERYELTLLRPPSFAALANALRQAQAEGRPFHILHFDGHGAYLKMKDAGAAASTLRRQMPLAMTGCDHGANGYLLFENADLENNIELVDGTSLGRLLSETGVPVLVLNACRSAHADIQRRPEAEADSHETVRAYGSLAQEVMDAGVAGVVAMRYNVYVATAVQFVAELYGALTGGAALGEAVTRGRKNLAEAPLRAIAFDPVPLQDWSVPVVYETTPLHLFPKDRVSGIRLEVSGSSTQVEPAFVDLPLSPDAGFFGRDETILAIDRAFDRDSVVLLHAYAGQGKTAAAAEFARWYAATGGLGQAAPTPASPARGGGAGVVLFTSFEQHTPLLRALDAIGQAFGKLLEQSGVQWLALEGSPRVEIALQVLKQIPVLWVWDNVETVAGFPAGSDSMWSKAEQDELALFLRRARQTKAKFLLTSRRDERGWLGDLPTRVTLPPMKMQERLELTRALAAKYNHRISDVDDWEPLLSFTLGNPMTITVLVGQALRDGFKHRRQIEAFVEQLRQGEAKFDDEASQGRSRSLGASLDYGFQNAFSEEERRVLALLHFFQGFVDVVVLQLMLNPIMVSSENFDWGLGHKDFAHETGIALLTRISETGLLTAHSNGLYSIHPALPWYFKGLFDEYYVNDGGPLTVDVEEQEKNNGLRPIAHGRSAAFRAFIEAMGELGSYYNNQYSDGKRDVINILRAEQANLLFARSIAHKYGWWDALIKTMQGLRVLYNHTGRRSEWKKLVDETAPDFMEVGTGAPLPGREQQWNLVCEYCVGLAMETRQWVQAERLQRACVDWNRHQAEPLLAFPLQQLDLKQRYTVRLLAAALHELGQIRREMGSAECISDYQEALGLLEKIGDNPSAAVAAFNLGHTRRNLPALRDLDQAHRWYKHSLELHATDDKLGRGKCMSELGTVNRQRFEDARKTNQPQEILVEHLNAALQDYQQALALLPSDALDDLSLVHNQMGIVYSNAGDLERALPHYNEAIRYTENAGDIYHAGTTRFNVALALVNSGRLEDGLLYAQAALRNYQQYGESTWAEQGRTERLIGEIEGKIAPTRPPP